MNLQEEINYHITVNREIPELLANIAQQGKHKEALELLIDWGTHVLKNSQVWERAKLILEKEVGTD